MKIKLNKNTFLKFIFINLIIINIKSKDNNIEDNKLFTCPKIKSINEIEPNMLCNELQLLLLLYYNNSQKQNTEFIAIGDSMFQKISKIITNTKDDKFKNYISNADEKTKKFFLTEEENKKEETNKE